MTAEQSQKKINVKDGTSLILQRWKPESKSVAAELLLLPGYADHSARYREMAHFLADRGIATNALDLRGHGRSTGQRGYISNFQEYLDDVDSAFELLKETRPRFVLGHSNGGLVALKWATERQPELSGVIATSPHVGLALTVPPLKLSAANILGTVFPRAALPSGLSGKEMTHVTTIADAYDRDPLVFKVATAGWFREVRAEQVRIQHQRKFTYPLLYVYSDSDPVSSSEINKRVSEQLECEDKTIIERPNEFHEVLHEEKRVELFGQIADWILHRV
ncbi:lysophospholipase [Myxococcota bacterium]|nr:lysophospholipase [Myxococcota bacterium]